MKIIPVLDVMDGQVVRGVGGRRDEYRPIVSPLATTPEPLAVARAFRTHLDLSELYLAVLDAIAGQPPAKGLYCQLVEDGFCLWVDAGLRDADQARVVAAAGVISVVAGLETISDPAILQTILCALGARHVVFSLDLKAGVPLRRGGGWDHEPWGIVRQALAAGAQRLLVLDLAQVGSSQGTGTENLCARIAREHPGTEVTAGGGVRGRDDLLRLRTAGVSNVLIASALHDGGLKPEDWRDLL
jgi:phosphoribosylformimino-5-aminoimidazole carboxamide ribotide isomerase